MGSGEFYDRLEPLPPSSSSAATSGHASLPHPPPPAVFSHFSSLYDEAAFDVGYHSDKNTELSSLDRKDITSLDHRGANRQSNHAPNNPNPAPNRSHPPHMSRDLSGGGGPVGAGRHHPHPLSPSDIEYQLFSPTGSASSRENSATPRQHQRSSSYDSRNSSRSISSTSHTSSSVGMADAPIRGSGRKDRNKPERGSGRNHNSLMSIGGAGGGGGVASPDLVMNGYATLPRSSSHSKEVGHATPTSMDTASLENLRLDDSESNMAFRRDNPGRISITKKSK